MQISSKSVADGVNQILMNTSDVEGEGKPTLEAAPKQSLLMLLESADDSGDGEVADDSPNPCHAEKKRRLSAEQVQSLEMSFEAENKLEPERKLQLAKELGLQARQVAIWFQNRRARWKTKQLERDYGTLKTAYDSLLSEKKKLQEEIALLHVKLETANSKGNSQVLVNRKDFDYQFNQHNTVFDGLPWKPAASSLYPSGNLMLQQPNSESREQHLQSPVASFDSNGGSLLTSSSEQEIQGLNVCSSSRPIDVAFDPKPASTLPSVKLNIGDSSNHVQVKEELFGAVCSPHSYQQTTFKLEDGFQESYSTAFFTLDEHGGWPWCWE